MHSVVTPHEMQRIDQSTISDYGITGEELMRRAGRAVFDVLARRYSQLSSMDVCILCGGGNNGGDGFVIARELIEFGSRPRVYLLKAPSEYTGDAAYHLDWLCERNYGLNTLKAAESLTSIETPELIVDALLGTGTEGDLRQPYCKIVSWINSQRDSGAYVCSVDIPSGLSGIDGNPKPVCVRANITVTIGTPKLGLLIGAGKEWVGEMLVADIGFPDELLDTSQLKLVGPEDVAGLFPRRPHDTFKNQVGQVLVIAGSKGMSGAAVLAARAALRAGAGLVRAAVPESIANVVNVAAPEVIVESMPETSEGTLSSRAAQQLGELIEWCDSVAIGPGLSTQQDTAKLILSMISELEKPAVIDADGLNALSVNRQLLGKLGSNVVLTPHIGEFCRLIGMDKSVVLRDRFGALRNVAGRITVPILLKGSPTIICAGTPDIYISNTGNAGMATAGSGDVLTGIIAAFLGQTIQPLQAAWAAAYVHGLCGDIAVKDKTEISLIASDLVEYLPAAFKQII